MSSLRGYFENAPCKRLNAFSHRKGKFQTKLSRAVHSVHQRFISLDYCVIHSIDGIPIGKNPSEFKRILSFLNVSP